MPQPSPSPLTLRRYAFSQWRRFAVGAAALLATNALGLVIPKQLKHAIDTLGHSGAEALPVIGRIALIIIGASAMQAVVRTFSRIVIFNGGREIEYGLRRDLFTHIIALPQEFHRRSPTGELMSRLTNDLSAVRMLFGPGILNVMNTTIVYATGLYFMVGLSPRLTLFAIIPLPLVVITARFASRRIYRFSRELQAQMGKLSNHLQEDFNGITTLRSYTLAPQRHARFKALSDGYLDKSLELVKTRGLLGPQFAIATGLGTLIVLWLGGREVIAGRLTVGGLVAFNAYFVYLAWPTLALGWVLSLWQRGLAGWQRVRELLREPATAQGDALPVESATQAALRVRDLSVVLGGRRILDKVSFLVPAGHTVAIVGRTGSGKSTLTDALLRLVEVPPHTLFVNDRDVTTLSLGALRSMIAYAPQDPFLFSATIADNIAYGERWTGAGPPPAEGIHDESAMARIQQAAIDAGLARDLDELPQGLQTMVGERGITLSGGQRQRVALARALYARTPLIILDDSLASVDAETEQTILRQLREHLGQRTAVLISHRVAAVQHANEILVLEQGHIAERGTHSALIAAKGIYAALYQEQEAARLEAAE